MKQFSVFHKTHGEKTVTVDDSDFALVMQFKWHCAFDKKLNRFTTVKSHLKPRSQLLLHRLIMGVTDPKIYVDHINGDIFDNRKHNLRIVSPAFNSRNQKKRRDNSSGYKGVFWVNETQKWRVIIGLNRKTIHIGYFKELKNAVIEYNLAAKIYHGQYARLNSLDGLE